MSLADWVHNYVPGGQGSKLGQLIENAMSEECAANTTQVSGLWPIILFQPNPKTDFDLYYNFSDERISYPWRQRPDSAPFERKARKAWNRGSDGDGPGRR